MNAHDETFVLTVRKELETLSTTAVNIQRLVGDKDNPFYALSMFIDPYITLLECHPLYDDICRKADAIEARRFAARNRLAAQRHAAAVNRGN